MSITNGYATLAEAKNYLRIGTTEATDDGVIEDLVEHASRMIDRATGRQFFATTATKYFDVPKGRVLWLKDDLLTVTTLTNGDAEVFVAADYVLWPPNSNPKNEVRLTVAGGKYWSGNGADDESVITIAGTWGYSATAPDDIKGACLQILANLYHRRFGENSMTDSTLTSAGVIVTPNDIPSSAMAVIRTYRSVLP